MATAGTTSLPPFAGDPAVCLAAPLTQKARGIVALSKFDHDANIPSFSIYSARSVRATQLVGYFARPCPMRPRHGFVESRVVHSEEEGTTLIQETLTADPEAEIVTMPHVEAKFSGIWTPGVLVIGKGTDGATSGTSGLAIPALGDLTKNNLELKREAGIDGTPYLELLWTDRDSPPQKVQLRDGPALPQSQDYVPEHVTVAAVVRAEGDLLEWETLMRTVQPGTVVYHPNGSLASHYAIHAVLNRVPVLISHEPTIGQELLPGEAGCGRAEIDIEAMRAGFYDALRAKVDQFAAVLIMLAGCHHIAVWRGKQDSILGLAMGFSYRLAVAAALGEMRHAGGHRHRVDREQIYTGCWHKTNQKRVRSRFQRALYSFLDSSLWNSGFGGRRWFAFTSWAAVIHNQLLAADGNGSLQALNQLVHSVHNNGWGFNKFVSDRLLDRTAENPVITLAECAPTLYQLACRLEDRKAKLAREFVQKAVPIGFRGDFETTETDSGERHESTRGCE